MIDNRVMLLDQLRIMVNRLLAAQDEVSRCTIEIATIDSKLREAAKEKE